MAGAVMSLMVSYIVLFFFSHEMPYIWDFRSATELSQFLRIFLPTLLMKPTYNETSFCGRENTVIT